MKTALAILLVLCVLCNVPKTCAAYTEDRNLGNFLEVFVSDLGGLVRGEGLIEGWVSIVEKGEPIMWALLLIGGPIALRVLPKKTLQKYIAPAPLVPKALVNPADVKKLKTLLRAVDKKAAIWGRVLRLFR